MNTIEILKRTDLFYNLTQDQLELIAAIILHRTAAQGEVIFEEGSKNREIFVIAQGSIKVSRKNYNNLSYTDAATGETSGEENAEEAVNATIVLAILSNGQSFGEIAFIDKATREATCRSLSDDTVSQKAYSTGYRCISMH